MEYINRTCNQKKKLEIVTDLTVIHMVLQRKGQACGGWWWRGGRAGGGGGGGR